MRCRRQLEPFTERASRVIEFQSMAYTTGADEGQLAQVKAVEAGYPALWPGIGWGAKGAQWPANPGQAWLNYKLAERLKVGIGDQLDIGEAQFRVAALFASEPDNPQGAFALSSRILINYSDVARTQSISPGARVYYAHLLMLKPGVQTALETSLKPLLDAHTRLVTLTNYRSTARILLPVSTLFYWRALWVCCWRGVALAIAAQNIPPRWRSRLRC